MINKIVDWEFDSYQQKNPSSWLNEELKHIYDNTIGPHCSPDPVECFVLYTLAKNSTGNILEIGSWRGRSSCFLAYGISKSGLSNRHLYCIDWFKGDSTGGENPDINIMKKSILSFNSESLVSIYNHDMLTFDYNSLSNIDLVFYDSDHNTKPTTEVLQKIYNILNYGAIVCLHDASWKMSQDAINNVNSLYKHITTLQVWEGFALLQKI